MKRRHIIILCVLAAMVVLGSGGSSGLSLLSTTVSTLAGAGQTAGCAKVGAKASNAPRLAGG